MNRLNAKKISDLGRLFFNSYTYDAYQPKICSRLGFSTTSGCGTGL